jgi:hypothetical protein
MPIGTPAFIGSGEPGSPSSTTVITTTGPIAVGDTVDVFMACNSNVTASSVTDSGGNTYAQIATAINGDVNNRIAQYRCASATNSVATSGTITATWSASANRSWAGATTTTGLMAAAGGDGTNTRAQINVSVWTANSVTTTNADDLLWGFAFINGQATSNTADTNWVELVDDTVSGLSGTVTIMYRIVSATGTYTAGGTWAAGSASDTVSLMSAHKMASGTISMTLTPVTQTNTAQPLTYARTYQSSWGDLGIEYGMLPFSGENFVGESGRRRYSLPPMSP